jgi:hypothetical protein
MSRGHGRLQRAVFQTILERRKPMTFEDIRAVVRQDDDLPQGARLAASFERSLRRALHGLCAEGALIALGKGGRAEPHAYSIAPFMVAAMGASLPDEEMLAFCAEFDRGMQRADVTCEV